MRFAVAMMGRARGGPAKVAVISSAIMGSVSGSVISNVLTTGAFTIPTMKKAGYPAHYAGAIEACASTGGTLMPPVMGAVAFIMASFLAVPYADIMVAAFLPALLFYIALLFQVDNYAARVGLKGMEDHEIPRVMDTLRDGWPYLFSLVMLTYMLLFMRIEAYAPYYATLVLLVIELFKRQQRLSFSRLLALLHELTSSVANLVAILAGIGLVVGGLSYTGVAGAFSRELLRYAGGNVPLMLIAGAVTSFVLGMGMTVSACYIFLSILLAPALIAAGLGIRWRAICSSSHRGMMVLTSRRRSRWPRSLRRVWPGPIVEDGALCDAPGQRAVHPAVLFGAESGADTARQVADDSGGCHHRIVRDVAAGLRGRGLPVSRRHDYLAGARDSRWRQA